MRRQLVLITLSALPLMANVFAQTDLPAPEEPANGMQPQDEMYRNDQAQSALTNEKFVIKAATGGLTEIEASRIALDRSKDPKIRKFAEQMVKEHMATNKKLQAIASANRIPVPDKPDIAQKAKLTLLKVDATGNFDKAYAEQMTKDHDETVALFEQAANSNALDPQLRSFAEKTLVVLRDHQKNAHRVLDAAQHISQN